MVASAGVHSLRARVALHTEFGAQTHGVCFSLRLTEQTLQRFLEDEHGDVNRATRRVVAWLRWREDNGVDTLLTSWPQLDGLPLLMRSYWPGCLSGLDHEGTPVQLNRCLSPTPPTATFAAATDMLVTQVRMCGFCLARMIRYG